MENLIKKYRYLKSEDYGELTKMIWDYEESGKADSTNKQIKILFFSKVKKEIDKILKERERKRGNNNGR